MENKAIEKMIIEFQQSYDLDVVLEFFEKLEKTDMPVTHKLFVEMVETYLSSIIVYDP